MPRIREEEVPYGPVLITKGTYRGRVGFYDDDHDPKTAIVWLANHLAGEATIDLRFLKSLSGDAAKWVREEMKLERKLRKGRICASSS